MRDDMGINHLTPQFLKVYSRSGSVAAAFVYRPDDGEGWVAAIQLAAGEAYPLMTANRKRRLFRSLDAALGALNRAGIRDFGVFNEQLPEPGGYPKPVTLWEPFELSGEENVH